MNEKGRFGIFTKKDKPHLQKTSEKRKRKSSTREVLTMDSNRTLTENQELVLTVVFVAGVLLFITVLIWGLIRWATTELCT